MDSFENWRREVNIILNDTIGSSLGYMPEHISGQVKALFDDGSDPADAAERIILALLPETAEQLIVRKVHKKRIRKK